MKSAMQLSKTLSASEKEQSKRYNECLYVGNYELMLYSNSAHLVKRKLYQEHYELK